ncbi:hypothetical protein [Candidatus Microthrix parvicella]|uniref:hypothetical protein n=1 Tax=Candidatus Neomicrothrix parvicella TaxID=41950 RepID=UPI0004B0153F|nr:hypothetical protein [Candidatus Microthrix parvicella]
MNNLQTDPSTEQSGPTVHVVMGDPLLSRSAEIYRERLAEAGVEGAERAVPPALRPVGRTSFHVVMSPTGEPVGVMRAALGTLDQLSLGELIDPDKRPHGLVCECPLIAVEAGAPEGTTELLYRSVYVFARRHGAEHLVASVDPMTLGIFRDEYGIKFRALGPVKTFLGFDSMAVGEELTILESGLRIYRPDFYDFLTEPFTDNERQRFGLGARATASA